MNEKPDTSPEEVQKEKVERPSIGGIIRKQRISMNISIDKISRDLKISKVYIQAIEDDNYAALPAMPYARGYVKGIAEYLSLDAVKLIKQMTAQDDTETKQPISPARDVDTPATADGEEKEETLSVSLSEEKKGTNYGFPILLLVLLGILAYFVVNQGSASEEVEDEYAAAHEEESLVLHVDTENEYGVEGEEAGEHAQVSAMELAVNVVRDSTWMEIVADGIVIREGLFVRNNRFTANANDSIAIRLGLPNAVEMTLGGNPVSRRGTSMSAWLITKDGEVRNLTNSEWRRIRTAATAP